MRAVLDSSALIAYLHGEPGRLRVLSALDSGVGIHAVNWAEVLSKFAERGISPQTVRRDLIERGLLYKALTLDPGHEDDALRVAELRPSPVRRARVWGTAPASRSARA